MAPTRNARRGRGRRANRDQPENDAGNNNDRPRERDGYPGVRDVDLTLEDLQNLSHEALRLKCYTNQLPRNGRKVELAARLFEKFHPLPPPPPPPQNQDEDPDAILNNPPDEIIAAEDEETLPWDVHEDDVPDAHDPAQNDDPPPPQPPTSQDIPDMVQSAVDSAVANIHRGLMEEIRTMNQKESLVNAENRALRSQINRLRTTTTANDQPQHVSSPARTPSRTGNTTFHFGQNLSQVPVATTASPSMGTAAVRRNPFSLPALLQKQLVAIEKGEYIDFDKLKPKKLGETEREDGDDGFGVSMSFFREENANEETLRFRKTNVNKIENFGEWLEVWNKFLSARLHYQPDEHSILLAYQRSITKFCRTHKFAAVYSYDMAFRKTIAAERSLLPEHRTTWWNRESEDLRNEHLFGQLIPPTYCFNCGEKGHMAQKCKNPFSGRKRSSGANYMGQQQFHTYPGFQQHGQPDYYQGYQAYGPQVPNRYPNQYQRGSYRQANPNSQNWPSFQQGYQQSQQQSFRQQNPRAPTPRQPRFPSSATPASSAHPHGHAQNSGLCNTWNHKGFCFRGQYCAYKHACNRCQREDHGGINCMHNTSSSFRPQF